MSKKMLRLRYLEKRLYAGIACLVLGISSLSAGFLLCHIAKQNYEKELKNPGMFDSFSDNGYCSAHLQYLTEYFAEHVKEGYRFYFGFDLASQPYVICMAGEVPEDLQSLIDYTYGTDEMKLPEPVEIAGFCEPLDTEIMGFARDSYSQLWKGSQLPISANQLSEWIGSYYLDIRPRGFWEQNPWAVQLFFIPGLVLTAGVFFLIRYGMKIRDQKKRTADLDELLPLADQELVEQEEFIKGVPVYLTEHYLITASYYFDLIPYDRITRVLESGGYLLAVTPDERAHIVAVKKRCGNGYETLKKELEMNRCEANMEKENDDAIISCN
ncbi:MAG: hypothetical protein Q4F29_00995 [Lachnospiraceae bacterium]|nr:hypothetical protein [Lachnospiraceae bacterium]